MTDIDQIGHRLVARDRDPPHALGGVSQEAQARNQRQGSEESRPSHSRRVSHGRFWTGFPDPLTNPAHAGRAESIHGTPLPQAKPAPDLSSGALSAKIPAP
jgi:hypothetical protein